MSNSVDDKNKIPRHVAIVMDGNGRWAHKRLLPRIAGHNAGVNAARAIIKRALECRIEVLSLFVFSSENWRRPSAEVSHLLGLFLNMLENEVHKLHEQGIQLKVIGDRSQFDQKLQAHIAKAEKMTAANNQLTLVLAANYGGRWDLVQAIKKIAGEIEQATLQSTAITDELVAHQLALGDLPAPDLFIRTSGEQRISNFFLWDLAYTELYFTDVLWPDFNEAELDKALSFFATRERRFGYTSEQLKEVSTYA